MITKYSKFIESISGTELIGHMGPNYPDQKIPNTINKSQTSIIFSKKFNLLVTYDDYLNLYNSYLKEGGHPLNGFSITNLDLVIDHLSNPN